MREEQFREWLVNNHPENRTGNWAPFIDGVRFTSSAVGSLRGSMFEVRLFHNGTLAVTFDMARMETEKRVLNLAHVGKIIKDYVLNYSSKAAELLEIASPLIIKVEMHGVNGLRALIHQKLSIVTL